jgi:hypothetical protein
VSVRRRRPAGPAIPERYARFVRGEWPAGLDCEEAIEFWHQARSAWARDHQYEFLGYLTSPLGDSLDLLKAEREAWLLNCCIPDPHPGESNGHGDWLWPRRSMTGSTSGYAAR